MSYSAITVAHDGGVATVTLNRPDKRNAISFHLVDELMAALDEIERSPSHVIILTGAGKAFCAGMDLDELKGLLGKTHDDNVKDTARMARIFRRLDRKSTRLNSSHSSISYAVFCLQKKSQ